MTIGQRIAQKRKELGLSQEALGEELGVSRQAIYKWESDATLPEIEKLVVLSKIFSVTVGWLLGAEEPAAEPGETVGSGELTPTQLQMVEEIVNRYQTSLPQAELPKKRRWPKVVAVVIVAAMAISLFRLSSRFNALQSSYYNLQNSVDDIDRRVGNQINSITTRVEDVLNRVNSFTTEQSAKIDSIDFEGSTVTLSLYAAPKSYTDGMTARFVAVSGGATVEAEGILGELRDFSASITIPLTNDKVELSVVFTVDSKQDIQPISTFDSLYGRSFPAAYMQAPPLFFYVDNDILRPDHYEIQLEDSSQNSTVPQSKIDMEKTRLGLFADGVLVHWIPRVTEQPSNYTGTGWDWKDHLHFISSEDCRLDRSKTYCLAAVIVDNYGRELVLPDTPICYREQEATWSFVESDNNGFPSFPETWVYE